MISIIDTHPATLDFKKIHISFFRKIQKSYLLLLLHSFLVLLQIVQLVYRVLASPNYEDKYNQQIQHLGCMVIYD